MDKYQICYASTFFKAMDKLNRGMQKVIARQIDKHLVNVDFPKVLGKYLTGSLPDYVRFHVGAYCIIVKVDDEDFAIMNVHAIKRSDVYKFKGKGRKLISQNKSNCKVWLVFSIIECNNTLQQLKLYIVAFYIPYFSIVCGLSPSLILIFIEYKAENFL